MKNTRGPRPRKVNEALQGRILQELLSTTQTTSQLVHHTREDILQIRCELIALHHLGVIAPIGVRTDTPRLGRSLYDRDYLWSITDHGMSHHSTEPGCQACRMRERMLSLAGGFS